METSVPAHMPKDRLPLLYSRPIIKHLKLKRSFNCSLPLRNWGENQRYSSSRLAGKSPDIPFQYLVRHIRYCCMFLSFFTEVQGSLSTILNFIKMRMVKVTSFQMILLWLTPLFHVWISSRIHKCRLFSKCMMSLSPRMFITPYCLELFPDHKARRPDTGSWFIQSICDVFGRFADKMDFISLMSKVSFSVSLLCDAKSNECMGSYIHRIFPRRFIMKLLKRLNKKGTSSVLNWVSEGNLSNCTLDKIHAWWE